MSEPDAEGAVLAERLLAALRVADPNATAVHALRRLSGGASQETWSFVLEAGGKPTPLILRRTPGGRADAGVRTSLPLAIEAKLISCAAAAGVAVPAVRLVLDPQHGIGSGFVMDFVDGETIPRKILRSEELAVARSGLARQCGDMLARIHSIPIASIPELPRHDTPSVIRLYRELYDAFDNPRPVFELAFRWLSDRARDTGNASVVHGDFRHGNLIVGADGLRAVLDWELAYVGDPLADLGWLCVNSWRFGNIDDPVGGFGARDDLYRAYEQRSACAVDRDRVHFWEVLGTLKWGVICMMMVGAYRGGVDRSVERAMIGRRISEVEIDLLALLVPRKEKENAPLAESASKSEVAARPPALTLGGFQQPSSEELIDAVRGFLESRASRELEGRSAFHAQVAVRALEVVLREATAGADVVRAATERLRGLIGDAGATVPLRNWERELCRMIRSGEIASDLPTLGVHLWETTAAQLAIDQPKYRPRPIGREG